MSMSAHDEKVMALFTIAHCTLKSAYIAQNENVDEAKIQEEVKSIFDRYADSSDILAWLRKDT